MIFLLFYSSKSITDIDFIISNVTKCQNLTYLKIHLRQLLILLIFIIISNNLISDISSLANLSTLINL